jgi:starch synthase
MKILLISPEACTEPSSGAFATGVAQLAASYRRAGAEVLLFSPYYTQEKSCARVGEFAVALSGTDPLQGKEYAVLRSCVPGHLHIRCDEYFARPGIYAEENGNPYPDNHLRYSFFVSAALDAALHFGFVPNVIHGFDWMGGLAAPLVKHFFHDSFGDVPVWLTIHDIRYNNICDFSEIGKLGLPPEGNHIDGYEFWGRVSLLKAAVYSADCVVFPSQGYLNDCLTESLPGGLRGFLEKHRSKLFAIQSGIDYNEWQPKVSKPEAKATLLSQLGLPDLGQALLYIPLFAEQEIAHRAIATVLTDIFTLSSQLLIAVAEDDESYGYFRAMAERHPTQIALTTDPRTVEPLLAADAAVLLAPQDPSASILLHALSMGCVPFTVAGTGCAGQLADFTGENMGEANALLIEELEPDRFIRKFRFVQDNYPYGEHSELQAAFQANARAFRCSWDDTARGYLALR